MPLAASHLCHQLFFATCQAATFATSLSLPPARQSAKDVFTDSLSLPPARIVGQSAKRMFADCPFFGRWQRILTVGKAQFSCSARWMAPLLLHHLWWLLATILFIFLFVYYIFISVPICFAITYDAYVTIL